MYGNCYNMNDGEYTRVNQYITPPQKKSRVKKEEEKLGREDKERGNRREYRTKELGKGEQGRKKRVKTRKKRNEAWGGEQRRRSKDMLMSEGIARKGNRKHDKH